MSRRQHSAISRIALNTLNSAACLALTMTIASARGAGESEKSLTRQLRIFCGSLIDGVSSHPLNSQTLTISDGTIISISETSPSTEIDLDLSDYTCLPGLINTHVHLDANPEDAADYGVYARRTPKNPVSWPLSHHTRRWWRPNVPGDPKGQDTH